MLFAASGSLVQASDHKYEDENHKEETEKEANPQVGPGKGILEADEHDGIRLGPEAEKNFEITRVKVTSPTNFELRKSAIVIAGTEVNLYRFRNGFYKRIDFDLLSKKADKIFVRSKDLFFIALPPDFTNYVRIKISGCS